MLLKKLEILFDPTHLVALGLSTVSHKKMLASIVLSVAIQIFIIKGKITIWSTFLAFLVGFGLFGWVTFGLLKVAGGIRDSGEPKNKRYNLASRGQQARGNSKITVKDQVSTRTYFLVPKV